MNSLTHKIINLAKYRYFCIFVFLECIFTLIFNSKVQNFKMNPFRLVFSHFEEGTLFTIIAAPLVIVFILAFFWFKIYLVFALPKKIFLSVKAKENQSRTFKFIFVFNIISTTVIYLFLIITETFYWTWTKTWNTY